MGTVLNVHLKDSVYDSQMSGDNGIIPTTPLSQLACSDPNKGMQSINTSTNKYIEDQHSLPDMSIDNHSNSTTTSILNPVAPPLLGNKKKPMTAKERKQLQRARQSEAKRLQELEKIEKEMLYHVQMKLLRRPLKDVNLIRKERNLHDWRKLLRKLLKDGRLMHRDTLSQSQMKLLKKTLKDATLIDKEWYQHDMMPYCKDKQRK